jgi:tetratricopeptide (TPR) repeat protein
VRAAVFALLLAAPVTAQPGPSDSAADAALAAPCRAAAESPHPDRGLIRRCSALLGRAGISPPVRLAMLMNRGIALLRAAQPARAADDFDLAIRAAPGLPEAWINKGMALTRIDGRAGEAVALITHGIELGAREPARAYFARAQAQELVGKLREAMEDYAAAAKADPDWPAPGEELKRFRVERRKVLRG